LGGSTGKRLRLECSVFDLPMTTDLATAILTHLKKVDALRAQAAAEPSWGAWVQRVKRYQALRFERTYDDVLQAPATQRAGRFFLTELYGDRDFTSRDAQFARIVPRIKRMFSDDLLATLERLSALHALSERMDVGMAQALARIHQSAPAQALMPHLTAQAYAQAWQAVGDRALRNQQVAYTLTVGSDLARLTRHAVLRHSLKLMRLPAKAAGLSALQHFLEEGFDAFAALPDARGFVQTVGQREQLLVDALFDATPDEWRADPPQSSVLGQLPLRLA
jgi:hypothetical protein